jgi:hypothetical protein
MSEATLDATMVRDAIDGKTSAQEPMSFSVATAGQGLWLGGLRPGRACNGRLESLKHTQQWLSQRPSSMLIAAIWTHPGR